MDGCTTPLSCSNGVVIRRYVMELHLSGLLMINDEEWKFCTKVNYSNITRQNQRWVNAAPRRLRCAGQEKHMFRDRRFLEHVARRYIKRRSSPSLAIPSNTGHGSLLNLTWNRSKSFGG